jgi:tetratricopeptide (TPR) repeat protein
MPADDRRPLCRAPHHIYTRLEECIQPFLNHSHYAKSMQTMREEVASEANTALPTAQHPYPPHKPGVVQEFVADFAIVERLTLFPMPKSIGGGAVDYLDLRKRQNLQWAVSLAQEAVKLAQSSTKVEAALRKFHDSLDVDAACITALMGRACLFTTLGQAARAAKDYEEVLKVYPGHEEALRLLGELKRQRDQAKQELESARRGEFLLAYDEGAGANGVPTADATAHVNTKRPRHQ